MLVALIVTVATIGWMATGTLVVSGTAEQAATRPPVERAAASVERFRVRAKVITAEDRPRTLVMRGRTRADALVSVAAETMGQIVERRVERGSHVAVGDVLCRLDQGVRAAQLAKAKAEADRTALDYNAATKLRGRGFESDTRVAATKAALDAASANVAVAEQELARTLILSPIEGVVQEPIAETGGMLSVSDVCATIVDADPIIVAGQVSERDIASIDPEVSAEIVLVTGETVTGKVGYISRTADQSTRTFTVELAVDNADGRLRDGVTAEARIPLEPVRAHRLSPGVLTLSDTGAIGVRTVDDDHHVRFMPVTIAVQDADGFWVTGLPDRVTIITVGQEYVVDGQAVDPVMDGA